MTGQAVASLHDAVAAFKGAKRLGVNARRRLDVILAAIGRPTPLRMIDDDVVAAFMETRASHVPPSTGRPLLEETRNHELRQLKVVLDFVRSDLGLNDLPEIDWSRHTAKRAKPEPRRNPLTKVDTESVLAAVRPDFRVLLDFVVITGMRVVVAIELRWPQVDFSIGRIRTRDGIVEITKDVSPILRGASKHMVGSKGFVFTFEAQRRSGRYAAGERYPISLSGLRTYWAKYTADIGMDVTLGDLERAACGQ